MLYYTFDDNVLRCNFPLPLNLHFKSVLLIFSMFIKDLLKENHSTYYAQQIYIHILFTGIEISNTINVSIIKFYCIKHGLQFVVIFYFCEDCRLFL